MGQASLQTCLLHACSSIHGGGWLGLVHQPDVREFASFLGCVPGSESVSPQLIFPDHRRTRHSSESRGRGQSGGRGGWQLGEVLDGQKCTLPRTATASNLTTLAFHVGWSGWTRPPVATIEPVCKSGVGGF